MQNISSVLTSLNRKVSPGNYNQSKDIYGVLAEGARNLISQIKPKELSKRIIIENALYDQIFKFKCPDDLDQKNVMQWFKLGNNGDNGGFSNGSGNISTDTFYHPMMQTTNRRFDQHRIADRNLFTIEWDKGVKFIKVSDFGQNTNGLSQTNAGLTISTMNNINDNGLWTTFGNVTNLIRDNLTYITGDASLRFDINNSSNTGGIENQTINPFSIKDFLMVGKIFTWLDLPNINQLQTVTLEMFSSAGNGYSITVNSPHDCSAFQEGQNMLGFILDPNVMTTIGTPDPDNINHVRITFVTNGTLLMNNVRIDNIVARKGTVYGIQYVSKFIFRDVNGIFKEEPSSASDEVMLEYEAYQLFVDQSAVILGQEIFTDTVMNKKGFIFGKIGQMQQKLAADYAQFRKINKSEFIVEQQEPYLFGTEFGYNSRGQYNGRRWDHSQDGI